MHTPLRIYLGVQNFPREYAFLYKSISRLETSSRSFENNLSRTRSIKFETKFFFLKLFFQEKNQKKKKNCIIKNSSGINEMKMRTNFTRVSLFSFFWKQRSGINVISQGNNGERMASESGHSSYSITRKSCEFFCETCRYAGSGTGVGTLILRTKKATSFFHRSRNDYPPFRHPFPPVVRT